MAVPDDLHRLLNRLVSQVLLVGALEGQGVVADALGGEAVVVQRAVGQVSDGESQVRVLPLHHDGVDIGLVGVNLRIGNVLTLERIFDRPDVGLDPVVDGDVGVHEQDQVDAALQVEALLEAVVKEEKYTQPDDGEGQEEPPLDGVTHGCPLIP
jgi:hypothetical protein